MNPHVIIDVEIVPVSNPRMFACMIIPPADAQPRRFAASGAYRKYGSCGPWQQVERFIAKNVAEIARQKP